LHELKKLFNSDVLKLALTVAAAAFTVDLVASQSPAIAKFF